MCVLQQVRGSRDNFQELFLSSHRVGLGDGTQSDLQAWWQASLFTEPSCLPNDI